MDFIENIREGLRSIQANMLRTVITALIITLGITALVGILTTVDGIQSSVDNSFADLGANTFDIKGPQEWRRRRGGIQDKEYPTIDYRQAKLYKNLFKQKNTAIVSISTVVSGIAQIKRASLKTNPNTRVLGIDDAYLGINGYKLERGRNITQTDNDHSTHTAVLGSELIATLFPKENPLGKEISVLGEKFIVTGVLEKKGSITGGGDDRVVLVPIETGREIAGNRNLTFDITTSVSDATDTDVIMGEATALMRQVRHDEIGKPDSFSVERSDALAKQFEDITSFLRIGGFGISIITLLGAVIALMNIMMVSVTERTREIGVRKSLGATPLKIRQQFLIEAIAICILGGIGGVILGIIVGNVFSKIIADGANFIIPWVWMLMGIVVCVLVGVISGFYPAYKASKLDPIESLRYE